MQRSICFLQVLYSAQWPKHKGGTRTARKWPCRPARGAARPAPPLPWPPSVTPHLPGLPESRSPSDTCSAVAANERLFSVLGSAEFHLFFILSLNWVRHSIRHLESTYSYVPGAQQSTEERGGARRSTEERGGVGGSWRSRWRMADEDPCGWPESRAAVCPGELAALLSESQVAVARARQVCACSVEPGMAPSAALAATRLLQ